jgi:glutathione S-transferase
LIILQAAPGTIAPANGTVARAQLQNVLSYVSTEVHPSIGGLFHPGLHAEVQAHIRGNAAKKLAYLESTIIGDKQFVVGNSFTVADSYLYIVLSWTGYVGIDLSPFPRVKAYFERIGALENVKAAHARIATSPATSI